MEGTGITPSAVASLLQTYTSGTQAGDVQIGGQSYPDHGPGRSHLPLATDSPS